MVKHLKKGYDIALVGKPVNNLAGSIHSDTYCFKPTDFKGISRPKVLVNEKDVVKAGTPIFVDKRNEKAVFTSPVSGEVIAVVRGEKRIPLEIKILADKTTEYITFPIENPKTLSKEQIKERLLESGLWINLLERPYGIIPNPNNEPKAIFISCFDSNPLAPDYEFVFKGQEKYLQAGIDALSKLTKGKVYLGIKGKVNSLFNNLDNCEKNEFIGPHPAGNVGVQIHHTNPINKGEIVWTTTPYGLQQIGRLFLEGKYDARKIITLTGSEVKTPQYYEVTAHTCLNKLLEGNIKSESNVRFISGNVLTGEKVAKDGYLGYYANTVTVIPEGNYYEFFGWIAPSSKKLSFSRALGLLSFLSPKKERVVDTNMHGEERAFVQTGEFEKVVPMDILPVALLKAIIANDYEAMEDLGIYEVLEEDFALCEFIDVSKMEVQALLRQGLDALMEA
jgi:Na+-transporting NADH:ubiquinone oxidoreductase subunit A